ncbi:MAG: MarR family winged helix-turn-helix transcriptional regulator [Solirubrobacterales bacterium]
MIDQTTKSPDSPHDSGAPIRLGPSELAAWQGFLRAHQSLIRELDRELVAEHRLSLTGHDVLVNLIEAEGGEMRMAELADAVLLSRSGLTRLVERLVLEGLVERRRCESDARGFFAVLTSVGATRLAEARPTHRAGVRRLFTGRFTEAELEQMAGFWARVHDG